MGTFRSHLRSCDEAGYNRPATSGERSIWFRGGATYNDSPYTIFGTPQTSSNYAVLALADAQLVKTDYDFPARGVYGGVSFISGDQNVDSASRY